MLNSAAPSKVFLKMTNMAVAIMAPAAVNRSAKNVKMVIGSDRKKIRFLLCDQRGFLEKAMGAKIKLSTVKQIPTMKQANIHVLAVLTMSRTLRTSVGSAILAPTRSSLVIISTGLNQYAVV